MEKKRLNRKIIYGVIFVLFIVEVAIFNNLRLFGIRPELLLIATLFFGFNFGVTSGVEVGVVCGILKDLFSVTTFGVNAISFLLIGFLSGYLKNKIFFKNFVAQFLLSNVSVYIISIIYFLYLTELSQGNVGIDFWRSSLYKGLYTGAIAPFLFFALTKVFETWKAQEP